MIGETILKVNNRRMIHLNFGSNYYRSFREDDF